MKIEPASEGACLPSLPCKYSVCTSRRAGCLSHLHAVYVPVEQRTGRSARTKVFLNSRWVFLCGTYGCTAVPLFALHSHTRRYAKENKIKSTAVNVIQTPARCATPTSIHNHIPLSQVCMHQQYAQRLEGRRCFSNTQRTCLVLRSRFKNGAIRPEESALEESVSLNLG